MGDSWDLYGIPGWGLAGKLLFLEVGVTMNGAWI